MKNRKDDKLMPLVSPARFDSSEIILGRLRGLITKALSVEMNTPTMTATAVRQRAAEMERVRRAFYNRMQSELITPLVKRIIKILQCGGKIR